MQAVKESGQKIVVLGQAIYAMAETIDEALLETNKLIKNQVYGRKYDYAIADFERHYSKEDGEYILEVSEELVKQIESEGDDVVWFGNPADLTQAITEEEYDYVTKN